MRNAMIALATLLVGVSLGLPSFAAAWATPGAACTQEGANANSDGFLTCTGGVWVSNAVLMGTTSATCDSTKAGYIRYTGGKFEGCNGTGWIQLASSNLKVYKADGVTLLGNLVGSYDRSCQGIVYTDSNGVLNNLSSAACYATVVAVTVFFSGSNCTGTTYFDGNASPDILGYCCTGSASCTTNKCASAGYIASSGGAYVPFGSFRNSWGTCTNNSATVYPMATVTTCSDNGTPCVVK